MSNRVTFQYTIFTDLNDAGSEDSMNYGYRVFDDFGQVYDNTFDSFNELKGKINRSNVLQYIYDKHYDFYDSIEEKGGMYFNSGWLTFTQADFDRVSGSNG